MNSCLSRTGRGYRPRLPIGRLLGLTLVLAAPPYTATADEPPAAIEQRLAAACRYLASEQLEGRGLGSRGIDLAAEFIAGKFAEYKLKTEVFEGKPLQKFNVSLGIQLGKENRLALVGPPTQEGAPPERIELQVGKDFNPVSINASATFDLPLVFAGYGATAAKEGYDDYAGLDVKGKLVIVLRHEPQQDNEKSPFAGKRDSPYATLQSKVATAAGHGAAGLILCTDEFDLRKNLTALRREWQQALDRLAVEHEKLKKVENPSRQQIEAEWTQIGKLVEQVQQWSKRIQDAADPLMGPGQAGLGEVKSDFPVLHCRRAPIDRIAKAALGADLAMLEAQIDQGPRPRSGELKGWRAAGRVEVHERTVPAQNVVAILPGEGPGAQEAVVVGAHYDHLGTRDGGKPGTPGKTIYPGADDNASGVAVMLEVARAMALHPQKPARSVVFAAFSGEERGLRGSRHYVERPAVPLEKTIAMVNLDMVGRLRNERLIVLGTGTAGLLDEVVGKTRGDGLQVLKLPVGVGPSDQLAFYDRKIPVLHLFTGTHGDYHKASDKPETLNVAGMRRIAAFAADVVAALAATPQRPQYVATPPGTRFWLAGDRPRLGIAPKLNDPGPGVRVTEVLQGSPAQKSGVKPGDLIVELGSQKIGHLGDLLAALGKHKAGDKVKTVLRRSDAAIDLEITLDP